MASWMRTTREAGWTAVSQAADGIYGVSVLAPKAAGERPSVIKSGFVDGGRIDAESLSILSRKISVPGCPWTMTLNRDAYKILVVAEPAVKAEELDQSVRWAISTMIDYPVSDANVAWMKIPTQASQPNRAPHLYVVATPQNVVAEHVAAFKEAKISLQAIDICETSQRNIAALVERQGEGVALLALGKLGVQFTVTFQGELYLDRFVKESLFGASVEDDAALERASERVVLQVQRSLDFVSRTLPFIDLNRVLLAPIPGQSRLHAYFSENLPVPVEDLDLATVFDLSQVPELSQRESQAGYFLALGAALRFMSKS